MIRPSSCLWSQPDTATKPAEEHRSYTTSWDTIKSRRRLPSADIPVSEDETYGGSNTNRVTDWSALNVLTVALATRNDDARHCPSGTAASRWMASSAIAPEGVVFRYGAEITRAHRLMTR
jgi:hypothetical protein